MRTKITLLATLIVATFAFMAQAIPNVPVAPGGFYEGTSVARVDANSTTAPTSYTPRKIGDVLLGKVASTNCMWIARGLTTNDWSIGITAGGPFTGSDITSSADLSVATVTTTGNGSIGGTLLVTGTTTCYGTATLSNLTAKAVTTVTESTVTRVCTSADYGKLILIVTNAAVAITLPANGATAGSWIEFMVASRSAILPSTDACAPTISAATTDTLIGPNDIDLKSVTWGTGHRIGAHAKFWSDGFFWHVQNLGGTTMTYTD